MKFFGQYWPDGGEPDVPTPFGALCGWCGHPIEPSDYGIILSHWEDDMPIDRPLHMGCVLRHVLGRERPYGERTA